MHQHDKRGPSNGIDDKDVSVSPVSVGGRSRVEGLASKSVAARGLGQADQATSPMPFGQPLVNAVQRRANAAASDRGQALATATAGVQGPSGPMPYLQKIQASFGHHDIGGVQAHSGPAAQKAADEIGASAYATGNNVAFGQAPDLHTAAHEAAHVVQQRSGVQLYGGVGEVGDVYEKHADAVADRVVNGDSAEDMLDGTPGASNGGGGVQRAVQKAPPTDEVASDVENDVEVGAGADTDTDVDADVDADVESNSEWAREKLKAIRGVRKSVSTSRATLKADSAETIKALREAQTVFRAFEKRHKQAKQEFEEQITKSLDKAQMIRDNVSFLLTTVLGMIPYTKLVTAMALSTGAVKTVSAALKVARTVETAKKVSGAVGKVKGAVSTAEKVGKLGAVGDVKGKEPKPPSSKDLDWEVLVDAALDSFEQYVSSTEGLDGLDSECDSVLDGLTDTALGTTDDGPTSALGKRAKALLSVGDISSKAAAPKAREFLSVVREKLEKTSHLDIQQQMGIAWVAALGDNDLEAIADCKVFLRSIKVIGPLSKSGLNIRTDEGGVDMMTDSEQQLVKWRAQVKIEADRGVGRRASWLGGTKHGPHVVGRIEFRGREYAASGPAAPRDDFCYVPGQYMTVEEGGSVLIDKAEFDEGLMESSSNWGNEHKDYKEGLHGAVHFSVVPTEGTVAGGNKFDSSGPEMSATD